jgi:hypothetical protein
VPTRVNSPSDVAFDERDSGLSSLSFTVTLVNPSFSVANSVLNGINPIPNQTTAGEGPVTGQEVLFTVIFTPALSLAPDHYFFIPQVPLSTGNFYWLSAPKPIVAPGTPFSPDLQAWIRNTALNPDWLRVGTDIVGGTTPPTFNGTFSLSGATIDTLTPTPTTAPATNTPTATSTSGATFTPTPTPVATFTPVPTVTPGANLANLLNQLEQAQHQTAPGREGAGAAVVAAIGAELRQTAVAGQSPQGSAGTAPAGVVAITPPNTGDGGLVQGRHAKP